MVHIPSQAPGPRCLVTNISDDPFTVISGIKLTPGEDLDLFVEYPDLTEQTVWDSMTQQTGDLWIETTVRDRLRIVDVDFETLDNVDVVYGHNNQPVFRRATEELIGAGFTEINTTISGILNQTDSVHVPIIHPGSAKGPGTKDPTVYAVGNLVALQFTVDNDEAHKLIKVPLNFVGDPTLHIHWTKSDDNDRSGERVKWQINYSVFNGYSEDVLASDVVVDAEDIYDDTGTTTRIIYRTPNMVLTGIERGCYIAVKVSAVSPSQDAMSEPALLTVDFIYTAKLNEDVT